MEQFYYLSDEFLKAHFNIPELGNYVLVQYRDGDQFFVSLGRKIKALRKQYRLFVDLRRGKICNPYADETHGLSCQILGRAVVKPNKKKREILVFNKNGELCITIAYEHIEKLYKDCWCGQDICSDLSLDDSAYIISRNFYARHFNIDAKLLEPKILHYTGYRFSIGYLICDSMQNRFIDIITHKIITLSSGTHALYSVKDNMLFAPKIAKRQIVYSAISAKVDEANNPLLSISVPVAKLDNIYRCYWYTSDITRRGWTEYRKWKFNTKQ